MNTRHLSTFTVISLCVLLTACQTTGGQASLTRYSLTSPADRALSGKEVKQAMPKDASNVIKPAAGLARGSQLSVTSATMRQPANPREGGEILLDQKGLRIHTGAGYLNTPSDETLGHMRYLGAGLILLGIALIALKFKFAILPIHLGIGVGVSGLVIASLPEIVQVTDTVVILLLIAGIAGLSLYLFLTYFGLQRSESTLGIIVQSIKELEDSDDPEKQHLAQSLKEILSKHMNRANKEKVDQIKINNRRLSTGFA